MFGRIIILVPFLALSCVSPPQFDVDLRFEDIPRTSDAQPEKKSERPDPAYVRFGRLEYGMGFEQVRAILGREPSRNDVNNGSRSCAWSFDGGSYANIEFDAKGKLVRMMFFPRL